MNCIFCGEPIQYGEKSVTVGIIDDNGRRDERGHVECQALGIIGHEWGVCGCNGFDTASRAAALELWRRMGEKFSR